MLNEAAHLESTADALRRSRQDLIAYLDTLCDRIDAGDPELQALIPEADRRGRLHRDAAVLQARFPDAAIRPPLYGIPVGVKDIYRVDGFPTHAGSKLPPELFAGEEASSVTSLRQAGALILGKTVTTEFAYFAPGPTRNPHNLAHTPGGSSSGSAAAVAAGFCPMALGSQTIGSVIRPAAFCGTAGFKPTFNRVPIDGVIPFAPSFDHVGFFARDAEGLALMAALLCREWQPTRGGPIEHAPTVGIPKGPYLAQAQPAALTAFEDQVRRLQAVGCQVRRVEALGQIAAINQRHKRLMAGEVSQVHRSWFTEHEALYHPRTAAIIREGQSVGREEQIAARAGQIALRQELEDLMAGEGIGVWICPAATGPAPSGLASTGDPLMNLPWTHTGMPALTLPAGAMNGLPLGLQCVASAGEDEWLVAFARWLEPRLK